MSDDPSGSRSGSRSESPERERSGSGSPGREGPRPRSDRRPSTETDSGTDSRPTAVGAALTALPGLVAAAVAVRVADATVPAATSAAGALLLAVALWGLARERRRTAAAVGASLLLLPVGVGAFAATVGTVLVVAGEVFPVASLSAVPPAVVRVGVRALVVAGATVAVLGAATVPSGSLDRSTVERLGAVTVGTGVPPFAVGTALATGTALSTAGGPDVVDGASRAVRETLLAPTPVRPHVATFALAAGGGLLAVAAAVRALPTAELTTGDPDPPPGSPAALAERVPTDLGAAFLLAVPVAALVEVAVPPRTMASVLPAVVYRGLVAVTAAPALRLVCWWLFVVGVVVVVTSRGVRFAARRSADRLGAVAGPPAVGCLVVLAGAAVARPVTAAGIDWLAATLPGRLGGVGRTVGRRVVDLFGPTTVLLLSATVLLALVALGVAGLWAALAAGYLPDTPGVALAAAGPFVAAAGAGVLGAGPPVVLGGVVAALVALDAGGFGAGLSAEVGRGGIARRTELVHAGGAVAVGVAGAVLAAGIAWLAGGALLVTGRTVAVGLLAGLAGLLLALAALR